MDCPAACSVAEQEPSHDDTIVQRTLPRGHETMLVVEDGPDLRETVVTALRQLGYQMLEAASGPEALALLAGGIKVDLLFTDIMMPGGMLDSALAQRAREFRPGLSVLFTTGYAETGVLFERRWRCRDRRASQALPQRRAGTANPSGDRQGDARCLNH